MSDREPPRRARGDSDNAAAWLAKAENDLLNIANNLAAERVPWDTVCFHAHQAAEKDLKAFLVHHGQLPARTHGLIALLQACVAIQPAMKALEDDCQHLTGYGVSARYPGDVYEPDPSVARPLVDRATGCRSYDHTVDEAMRNIAEATALCLEDARPGRNVSSFVGVRDLEIVV